MNAYFSKSKCFMKKYVALVVAVIVLMLVGVLAAYAATSADHTIYISGTKGSLSNAGETPSAPVLTFRQAYEGLKDTGGRIYVVNTVAISSDVTLAATYYEDSEGRIDLADGCSVNIMRFARPRKTIEGFSVMTNSNFLIQVAENAKLTLSGITIDGHKNAIDEGDPTIIAYGIIAGESLIDNKGVLHLRSGAVLQNSRSRGEGGAVVNSGTLYLDGCSIQDNYSVLSGGAIYNTGSISFLSNSSILRNEAVNNGGGIYSTSSITLNQFASIKNNRSDYGGGAFIDDSTGSKVSLLFDGATVSGNVAYRGGGVFLQYAEMTLISGQVTGNAAGFGGGIYLNGDPANQIGGLTLKGGEISGNKGGGSMSASIYTKGAGIYNVGGRLVMDGGSIINNGPYSTDNFLYGGGICQEAGGTITVNAGTITDNSAYSGGGIYNIGTLDIAGGVISGNNAENGGAVYNSGTLTARNFEANGNTATVNGGAFFNAGQKVMSVSDGVISGNKSVSGGGIYNVGTLSIISCDISSNEADYGAGIYNGDVLTVDGTSVDGNIAAINGGGIFNESAEIDVSLSNVLETGIEFVRDLPASASSVVFTDEAAPDGAALTDVSAVKDMGVVAWLDGSTYKVSTQRSGVPVMANKDSSYMFKETYYDLESIDFTNFDTSQVEDMSYMFYCCWGLTELDLSGFDTRKVTDMTSMFYMCEGLITLDLSCLDTRNVKEMNSLLYACWQMETINLGGKFNTSSVENMDYMFMDCYALKDIDFKNFDTSNVTTMQFMFSDMEFETLNLSNFDTSKVENMECMFANNREAKYLDLSNFDTSSVTNMEDMFYNMRKLERVTLGEKFVFVGENSHFEEPNSQYVTGATGNWYNTDGEEFAPDEVPSNVADSYFASPLLVTKDVPKNVPGVPDVVEDSGESEIVPIPGSIVTGQGLVTVCGGSVSNNEAKNGAGIYNNGDIDFVSALANVEGNTASTRGGGIYSVTSLELSSYASICRNLANFGGGVYMADGSVLTFNGASVMQNEAASGGGVWLQFADMNMVAGSIHENKAGTGAGIYLNGNLINGGKGTLTLLDGKIEYNEGKQKGAGIYNYCGAIVMKGGSISYNVPYVGSGSLDGGGIYLNASATLDMSGGVISDNNADQGAGIFMIPYGAYPEAIIRGDSLITGNIAYFYGGGICNYACKLTVDETAVISSNTAHQGGGIYHISSDHEIEDGYGTAYINGGTITNNCALFGSGIYNTAAIPSDIVGGKLIISGGKITDNKPSSSDDSTKDGVYNFHATIDMSGGLIEKSEIGIYNDNGKVTISGNKAEISSCGQYGVYQDGLFQVKDGPEVSQPVFLTPDHFITVIGPCTSDFIAAMDDEDTFEGRVIANYTFDASGQKDLYSLDENTKGYADAKGIGVGDKALSSGEYPYCILLVEIPKEYTVHYNGNTADGGSMEPDRHVVGVEKTLTENGFAKTGYVFTGWNTAADGSGTSYTDKQVVKDLCVNDGDEITLYAQWAPIQYTVKYHANGGSGVMADSVHVYDSEKALTENSYQKKGYEFVGWATSENGEIVYQDGQSVKNLTAVDGAVIDLYAVWKVIEYKITYDPQGGTMPENVDDTYTIEDEVKLPEPTKPGYEFEGWREDTDGDGEPYGEIVTEIPKGETGDKHFVAEWEPITYKVKYNANGGTGTMSDSIFTYDVEQALSENGFVRVGYDFGGWNTKPDGSGMSYADQQVVKNLSSVDGDVIELYAQWNHIDISEPDPPTNIPETPTSGYLRFIKDKYFETLPAESKWRSGLLRTILLDVLSADLTDPSDCTQVWRIPADEFENIHEWCKDHDKGSETNKDFLSVFGKYRAD